MIDLELYKIFFVVAEAKSITKASNILYISQPAITKQIKKLENQLNTTLFIRTTKGMVLNECGEKIYIKVKKALSLLDEAEQTIKEFKDINTGTIKIGTSKTLSKKYLIKYIEKFHKDYPNIIVDIYTNPTKELIKKLKNGNIDLIIGKFPYIKDKELEYNELGKSRYVFAANKKYYNFNKKVINAKELEQYPIILQEEPSNSRSSVERYFEANDLSITPKMNIASSSLLIDFIAIGFGIGYITELFIEDEIKNELIEKIEVHPQPEEISFGIIQLKNNTPSNCSKKFIDYLKNKSN